MDQRLIGQSGGFLQALQQASKVAMLNKPVLLVGERGTGKELFAARIHFLSRRWEGPYLQVNCGAFSEALLESELFGHEAGAFTGAVRRHQGRFERADGGTLFLDEIATASARVQEQLLRVVEYGQYERLGGRDVLQADVRLIAATNEDLPALATTGRFRHDLLDRLSFDVITLPPLRQRLEDILLLAESFATLMTQELEKPVFPGFGANARDTLLSHRWPGNVRELKNAVERSLYRHEDWEQPIDVILIDPFDSPYRLRPGMSTVLETSDVVPVSLPATPILPLDLKVWLGAQEKAMVETAMQQSRFNQRQAATLLGLNYHQFRAILRRSGLPGRRPRE